MSHNKYVYIYVCVCVCMCAYVNIDMYWYMGCTCCGVPTKWNTSAILKSEAVVSARRGFIFRSETWWHATSDKNNNLNHRAVLYLGCDLLAEAFGRAARLWDERVHFRPDTGCTRARVDWAVATPQTARPKPWEFKLPWREAGPPNHFGGTSGFRSVSCQSTTVSLNGRGRLIRRPAGWGAGIPLKRSFECLRCGGLSHRTYLLFSFRKSTPPQYRQVTVSWRFCTIANKKNELTILLGCWLSKSN